MSNAQLLGAPQEFNEAMLSGGGALTIPKISGRPTELVESPHAPRLHIMVPTGGGRSQAVSFVNKRAQFHVPVDQLRGRWQDVVKRPNGRVMVYDGSGAMLARFETWDQAVGIFKKAGILKDVEEKLAAQLKRRLAEEKAARDAQAQKVVMSGGPSGGSNDALAAAIIQLSAVMAAQGKPAKKEKADE